MGGWAFWIVLLVLIAAGVFGLLAYRRRTAPDASRAAAGTTRRSTGTRNAPGEKKEEKETRKKPEQWGVRISAPPKERSCPQVRALLNKEFPIAERPQLPLKQCPFPQKCECRFVKLTDRRSDERRSGQERRHGGERFEKDKPPRRKADRRKKNIDWI